MKLSFLGATQTVTGSKYLLESGGKKVLIDCGLFQGRKDLRLLNWQNLPIKASQIDAVILTHAHIDHSGYIPKLVKAGFKGTVYCSDATLDLCKILLPDSGFLHEADAKSANHHGYSKHHPALPLYTEEDAVKSLKHFKAVSLGFPHIIADEFKFTLHRAGHILGACFIHIEDSNGTSVLFSGDIGRMHNPIIKPPAKIQNADYLVVESTYGDRLHSTDNPTEDIGHIIRKTARRGGTVLIPAFAVGRAQMILYYLYVLKNKGEIPNLPIYLDSPMAINVTKLLQKHMNDHRLSEEECDAICSIATYTCTAEESKAINNTNGMPKVIISASGMATGGRILHHLKHYLGDRRNTILFTGYQAQGTRGDRLVKGEKTIKIHGSMWPVNADVVNLDSTSAHADYGEILKWLENFKSPPKSVFITHGEETSANTLKDKIQNKFGWDAIVPTYLKTEDI